MQKQFWDERYGGTEELVYGAEPNDFLAAEVTRIPRTPPARVLCLAEGEGRNATFLAAQGYDVTGVDYSRAGLAKAARLAAARGVHVTLVEADLATYDLGTGWSGIVSIFAHTPAAIRARIHAAIPAALAPGGVFLLEAYRPAQLALGTGGPKDPTMLPSLAQLRHELAGLDFELAREVDREIYEGPLHGGPSATVQLAARRRPSAAPFPSPSSSSPSGV